MHRGLWLFLTALAATAVAAAQAPTPSHNFFQSRVDLIGVPVTVVTQDGTLVTGLSKDDFEIFEDGDR